MEDMITNNYYLVLEELEKKSTHPRELSRKTGLSHTQVGKILNYFYKQNVLEKTIIGKSIIYEIKKNVLSLNYLVICKKLKLIHLSYIDKKMKVLFEEISSKLKDLSGKINCLILFGSYSKGFQKKSSDIDLFFVSNLNNKVVQNKMKEIEESFGIKINIKILDLDTFKKEKNHPLTLEVLEGIPLINSELFYELKWLK